MIFGKCYVTTKGQEQNCYAVWLYQVQTQYAEVRTIDEQTGISKGSYTWKK